MASRLGKGHAKDKDGVTQPSTVAARAGTALLDGEWLSKVEKDDVLH